MTVAATDIIRYQVTGMDCSSCAAKIEGAARKVEGINGVKVFQTHATSAEVMLTYVRFGPGVGGIGSGSAERRLGQGVGQGARWCDGASTSVWCISGPARR